MNLPGIESKFTLELANGAIVYANGSEKVVLHAESGGTVEVYEGKSDYQPAPTGQRTEDPPTFEITAAHDSNGISFDFALLYYQNEHVSGIVENILGDRIGFENTGEFISDGTDDTFVFRVDGYDYFYLSEEDDDYVSLDLKSINKGIFDLHFELRSDGIRSFIYKNIDTNSLNIFVEFIGDSTYIKPSSDVTYDLEIRNEDGETFIIRDITLPAREGYKITVLSFEDLSDEDAKPVQFGRDVNGDGQVDETIDISTGMTWNDIKDKFEKEDKEDEEDFILIIIGIIIVVVILLFVIYLIFGRSRHIFKRRKSDREEAFRLLREELKAARERPAEGRIPEPEGVQSWDDLEIPPDSTEKPFAMGIPMQPTIPSAVGAGYPDEDRLLTREPGEPELPPEFPEGEGWGPEEPEVSPELTEFREEFKEIDQFLRERSKIEEITSPLELKKKVIKHIEETDDWWDEWNEDLDEMLKK